MKVKRIRTEALSTAENSSVSRKAVVSKNLVWGTEHVSGAVDRVEQRRFARQIDLAAQMAHMHLDHIGARVEMIVPDGGEQHRARQHLAGMAHHIFEERQFARLQLDRTVAAPHLAR